MTKEEAIKELQNMEEWKDFGYWAYLKMVIQELPVKEMMEKVSEADALHKVREARMNLHKAEQDLQRIKMLQAGASVEETNNYARSQHRRDLVDAWRRLD